MLDSSRDVLLLDGDCGLCHQLAFFLDPRLAPGVDIAYRPIKSDDAQKLIHTFSESQHMADTVYLLRNGRSYIRSAAAIRCLLYLRWYWKIWFFIFWLIPLPIRDLIYRSIAKYRHWIFKKPEICTFRVDWTSQSWFINWFVLYMPIFIVIWIMYGYRTALDGHIITRRIQEPDTSIKCWFMNWKIF